MIDEAQALRLLDEANPVPDLESYQVSEADIAAHLATLTERSSEMRQPDTRIDSPARSRQRHRLALTGVLTVVLAAAAVTLVTLTGEDSIDTADDRGLAPADFVGTWTAPVEGISALFIYLDESGRYALSDSFGAFEERTIEAGTWTFDGEEFVFMTDSSSSSCPGTVAHYEAQRLDDERIRLTPAEPDPCRERQDGIALGPWRSYPLDPELSG